MATRSASKTLDLQGLVSEAARIELRALNAGAEYWQVWAGQAAKLSDVAGETLKAMESDRISIADTAKRLAKFGKGNADAFVQLYGRLAASYFDELARLADRLDATAATAVKPEAQAKRSVPKKTTGAKAGRRKKASAVS